MNTALKRTLLSWSSHSCEAPHKYYSPDFKEQQTGLGELNNLTWFILLITPRSSGSPILKAALDLLLFYIVCHKQVQGASLPEAMKLGDPRGYQRGFLGFFGRSVGKT